MLDCGTEDTDRVQIPQKVGDVSVVTFGTEHNSLTCGIVPRSFQECPSCLKFEEEFQVQRSVYLSKYIVTLVLSQY